jgi:hypothetical protein
MNKRNLSQHEIELFHKLHDERKLDARTFNKPSYRGIWTGIVDKYKEKAHFVYELLQNADDAQASEATFCLETGKLIFRHNGKIGFSVSSEDEVNAKSKGHINAITGVGNSTKNDTSGNTIGKFGVGFKAVFQYTHEPYIYDDKFWFKIEDYIVPTEVDEDFVGRLDGETVFVFPFFNPNAAFNEITTRLSTLNNPILFLRHLRKVIIRIPDNGDVIYEKRIVETEKSGDISHELLLITNYGVEDKIHMFTRPITISADGKLYSQYISVGYFLNKDGNLDVKKERNVFCFFPTAESFGLKCVVHAPFLLVDSRQQLKDAAINTQLKDQLAKLSAKSLVLLKDYGISHNNILIDENVFDIIPGSGNFYSADCDVFRKEYFSSIWNNKMLLSRKNEYINYNEALICRPVSMMSILSDKQVSMLINNSLDEIEEKHDWHFLREETQRLYTNEHANEILQYLGVDVYDGERMAKDITADYMQKNGLKWAKRLYSHLRKEQISLWKRQDSTKRSALPVFCKSPIILTSKNKWVPAYTDLGTLNVYLPLIGSSDEYTFVSPEYLSDKDLRTFIQDFGLKQPDVWDYIQTSILDKYEKGGTFSKEVINTDLEVIYNYISRPGKGTETQEEISVLQERYLLVCKDYKLRKPNGIYKSDNTLFKYLCEDEERFVLNEYYKPFIDKYSIQQFVSFIEMLGVASIPKVVPFNSFYPSYTQIEELNISNYTWMKIEDYKLDGFEAWVPRSINESKNVWQWLSEIYKNPIHRKATVEYQYYQIHYRTIDSTLIRNARYKKWIILSNGASYIPADVSLEQLEESEYYIDYELIKLFGIERKTKSLSELGASDIQIEQNEVGRLAQKYGFETEEDFKEAQAALLEKKNRERKRNDAAEKNDYSDTSSMEHSPSMSQTSLDEMSSSMKEYSHISQHIEKSTDERALEITQKLADEANKRIEVETKRASIDDLTKYSDIWFKTLLELEYQSSMIESDYSRSKIKVTFERFQKERDSSYIYVLSNPSRNIPIWLEEIGGLSVRFTFFNKDDISISFDVANVKDFTLRLKAKPCDVVLLDSIINQKCNKAIIEVNNPVELMSKLNSAFAALGKDDTYNYQTNLRDNISFVFGPPGTGKTTRLAEIISTKMTCDKCRVLVLAPTNKACDVLTKKIIDTNQSNYSWLGRFVATGDDEIERSGVIIDRESNLYDTDRCCVISTIARLSYDGFTQSKNGLLLKDINWDFVIIDEASMIPLVQIVYSLYKLENSKFIIAGDPHQIAPIVREKGWIGENIYTMVGLDNFENPSTHPIQFNIEKLSTQYRSVPSIGKLYSEYSYDGMLEHSRSEEDIKQLPFGLLTIKPITFMPFNVERFDSIFGAKKLNGSNVHIYSAIFSVEVCAYIAKQQDKKVKIGVICPYAPQAQLINKLIEQRTDIPEYVEIACGTIHGFQGDQCEIIVTVLNPPTGIKVAPEMIMLNNKNVINVAVSRASDYLILLLPHPNSFGYENLIEINRLCKIANSKKLKPYTMVANCDCVERQIFGTFNYIEYNTFVTTHQLANVYSKTSSLYEVRIDDNAVDIQVGGKNYSLEKDSDNISSIKSSNRDEISCEKLSESDHSDTTPKADIVSDGGFIDQNDDDNDIEQEDNENLNHIVDEMVTKLLAANTSIRDIIRVLYLELTPMSIFIVFKILGSSVFREKYSIGKPTTKDLRLALSKEANTLFKRTVYDALHRTLNSGYAPFKPYTQRKMDELKLQEFEMSYIHCKCKIDASSKKKGKRPKNGKFQGSPCKYNPPQSNSSDDNLYENYEYGMSDW